MRTPWLASLGLACLGSMLADSWGPDQVAAGMSAWPGAADGGGSWRDQAPAGAGGLAARELLRLRPGTCGPWQPSTCLVPASSHLAGNSADLRRWPDVRCPVADQRERLRHPPDSCANFV